MENSDQKPTLPGREPAMGSGDWRAQLPPDSRQKLVDKITGTLEKCLPYTAPDGINEFRRIAARFEEKVFSSAINQTDYLRIISMRMLTVETESQNNAAGSTTSIPTADCSTPLDSGHVMENSDRKPTLPGREPAMDAGDWRAQLPPDSRQMLVNKIMGTLKKCLPYTAPDGINEFRRIAARFEEKVFSSAINQTDYLRIISTRMLTMESDFQNSASGSTASIPTANNNSTPLDPARLP